MQPTFNTGFITKTLFNKDITPHFAIHYLSKSDYPLMNSNPVGNYMFKVNDINRTKWEIFSKLTMKIPKRRQWRRSGVFIVNFEHISHFFQVSSVPILNFEQGWN